MRPYYPPSLRLITTKVPLMYSGKFQPGGTPAQDNVTPRGSQWIESVSAAETLILHRDAIEEVVAAKEGRTQGLCCHAAMVH